MYRRQPASERKLLKDAVCSPTSKYERRIGRGWLLWWPDKMSLSLSAASFPFFSPFSRSKQVVFILTTISYHANIVIKLVVIYHDY